MNKWESTNAPMFRGPSISYINMDEHRIETVYTRRSIAWQYLNCLLWIACAVAVAVLFWNDYTAEKVNRNLAAHLEVMQERIEMLENTVIHRSENR